MVIKLNYDENILVKNLLTHLIKNILFLEYYIGVNFLLVIFADSLKITFCLNHRRNKTFQPHYDFLCDQNTRLGALNCPSLIYIWYVQTLCHCGLTHFENTNVTSTDKWLTTALLHLLNNYENKRLKNRLHKKRQLTRFAMKGL